MDDRKSGYDDEEEGDALKAMEAHCGLGEEQLLCIGISSWLSIGMSNESNNYTY